MERKKVPGAELVSPLTGQKQDSALNNANETNPENFRTLAVDLAGRQLTALEARWAKFFDLLNVNWVLGWPLTFWLPFNGSSLGDYPHGFPTQRGLWVAVSEFAPNDEMCARLRDLAARSGHWTHLLVGEPQPGFEVWSWRQSDCINIDGRHGVADFEQCWEYPWVGGTSFDLDFAINTVGASGPSRISVQRAFQLMQWETAA